MDLFIKYNQYKIIQMRLLFHQITEEKKIGSTNLIRKWFRQNRKMCAGTSHGYVWLLFASNLCRQVAVCIAIRVRMPRTLAAVSGKIVWSGSFGVSAVGGFTFTFYVFYTFNWAINYVWNNVPKNGIIGNWTVSYWTDSQSLCVDNFPRPKIMTDQCRQVFVSQLNFSAANSF